MSIIEQKMEGLQPKGGQFQKVALPNLDTADQFFQLDDPNFIEIWIQFSGSGGKITQAANDTDAVANFGNNNHWPVGDGFRLSEYRNKGLRLYVCSDQSPGQGELLFKKYFKGPQ